MFRLFLMGLFLFSLGTEALAAELATVNDKVISTEDVQKLISTFPPQMRGQYTSPEGIKGLLNTLISRELLHQEGVKRGLEKDPTVQSRLEQAKRDLIISSTVEKIIEETMTDQEIKNYFQKHKDQFKEIEASHILVETEEEAKKIRKQIKDGGDFAELARKFSKDTGSGQQGGDLGFFTKDKMVPAFAEKAFSMKVNEVSGPVKTEYGYHVIKVKAIKEPKSADDLPPESMNQLKRNILDEQVNKLKSKAKIKINEEQLKGIK
jgi:peptidyl-prolyl cis-trans isomerase C